MDKEEVRYVTMDDLAQNVKIDYVDGDIAFVGNISIPPKPRPFKMDAIRLFTCVKGSLKVEINAKEYTIHPNEILCCGPNVLVCNVVPSADLECKGLIISTRTIRKVIHLGTDMRNKIFYINQNPVLPISDEGVHVFEEYHNLLQARMKASDNPYRKDIIFSLVSGVFYELLAHLDKYATDTDNVLIRQGDLLFKRFIELLVGMKVKERSVTYYADKLFVTSKYLSTVCKKVSGKTAFELINQLVIEDITQLLKYSEKSIKEISDDLDFPSLSFFGKYIKAHTGVSPTEYRRQLYQK